MMSSEFDQRVVGRRFDGPPFYVEAARIAAYAAATNDESAGAQQGDTAPAVFSYVPLRPVVRAMLSEATPLYGQLKGLHGEQDIVVHTPIRPGMTVMPTGTIVGLRGRSSGVAVIGRIETHDEGGNLLNEQYVTVFFRGARLDEDVGADAPDHRLPAEIDGRSPDATVTQSVDADQPARYAAASGDTGRYHLDESAALAVGLPGIIVHGMCTMAFAGRAVVQYACDGDPARVRRLAVRFALPVRPGEMLTSSVWRLADGALGLETRNSAGEVVLAHGRAELA